MNADEDLADEDGPPALFSEDAIPLPEGADNLAALRHAIAAARRAGRLVAEDEALVRAAESGARAMDRAEKASGDKAAYAFAAAARSYQDVLERLGLNGRGEVPTAGGAQGPTAQLLEALGRGPA